MKQNLNKDVSKDFLVSKVGRSAVVHRSTKLLASITARIVALLEYLKLVWFCIAKLVLA